ncbi:E3 ubiquitin-protein ligase mind-bomb-like [Diadema antillarum]|uniref:E3 ubiquitin-protein ligase mind-bomb-like n=1 Tax=Diadema antillarum TaxID=105358 RepID=UPI003A836B7D
MSLRPGLRVVRGPDWKWEDQDGGAGHVGTVVSFGDDGTQGDGAMRVNVKWDRGLLGDYRMGFENAFDLRILDNGSVGDHHAEVQCNGCNLSPIHGMRWCCAALENYDLCSKCYHEGRNFTEYIFTRILIPGAKGDAVPPRRGSTVSEVKGLFPGAKVKLWTGRPSDPSDERRRRLGKIDHLCDWKEGYASTGAVVDWPPDERGIHCIGFEGRMDLRTKESASGGVYYLDHLPILGKAIKMEVVEGLVVGSHVTIDLPRELLVDLQQGHGEWVEGMEEDIGHVGVVRDWTNERDAIVEFPHRRKKWIFHPAALTKVSSFDSFAFIRQGPDTIFL